MSAVHKNLCQHSEVTSAYAIQALASSEVPAAEAHIASCPECQGELFPGDYNYGAPGASDDRVWSEAGCTCVLVTSTMDGLNWTMSVDLS